MLLSRSQVMSPDCRYKRRRGRLGRRRRPVPAWSSSQRLDDPCCGASSRRCLAAAMIGAVLPQLARLPQRDRARLRLAAGQVRRECRPPRPVRRVPTQVTSGSRTISRSVHLRKAALGQRGAGGQPMASPGDLVRRDPTHHGHVPLARRSHDPPARRGHHRQSPQPQSPR